MKENNFRGGLSDISATNEPLLAKPIVVASVYLLDAGKPSPAEQISLDNENE